MRVKTLHLRPKSQPALCGRSVPSIGEQLPWMKPCRRCALIYQLRYGVPLRMRHDGRRWVDDSIPPPRVWFTSTGTRFTPIGKPWKALPVVTSSQSFTMTVRVSVPSTPEDRQ